MGSPEAGPECVEDLERLEARLAGFAASGTVVVRGSTGYPLNLEAVPGAPRVLFVRGALTATDTLAVSVIGSRRASATGLASARLFAGGLAGAGVTVVSGLALGIDGAAHAAALAAGGRTIAVLGSGLDRVYPSQHAMLAEDVERSGALVSQWWPWTPPAPDQFRLRNAVSSGLSLATVVVEASARSGARLQGRLALEQGRLLALSAGLVAEEAWARALVETTSALVVRGADDVLKALEDRCLCNSGPSRAPITQDAAAPPTRPGRPGQSCQLSLDIG